jgi:hypothetical protein
MDFNYAICASDLGYPLITGFSFTETSDGRGDGVYMPGSIISHGERKALSLFSWNGRSFEKRSRELPLFCPLVLAEREGNLEPLVQLHWRRMTAIADLHYELEAAIVLQGQAHVKDWLSVLFESSPVDADGYLHTDIVSKMVTLDGLAHPCRLRRIGKRYECFGSSFQSTASLVECALIPLQALVHPNTFFHSIRNMPASLPILSGRMMVILLSLLGADVSDTPLRLNSQPFDVHLHWGARHMAGYPPRVRGYLSTASSQRRLQRIFRTLANNHKAIRPIKFVLLPAAVFMLHPTDAHQDAEPLEELFEAVTNIDIDVKVESEMQSVIDACVKNWLYRNSSCLSSYFLNRFLPKAGVLHSAPIPERSHPIEPRGFRSLTFRQACMLVGSFSTQINACL